MERHLTRAAATAALALMVGAAWPAAAQTQPRDPNMPAPQNTIPEKVDPPTTGSTGSGGTLSERLEQSEGVIRPPAGVDPEIRAPAPVPNPGTTPVIPPPGSPGGNQAIQPK